MDSNNTKRKSCESSLSDPAIHVTKKLKPEENIVWNEGDVIDVERNIGNSKPEAVKGWFKAQIMEKRFVENEYKIRFLQFPESDPQSNQWISSNGFQIAGTHTGERRREEQRVYILSGMDLKDDLADEMVVKYEGQFDSHDLWLFEQEKTTRERKYVDKWLLTLKKGQAVDAMIQFEWCKAVYHGIKDRNEFWIGKQKSVYPVHRNLIRPFNTETSTEAIKERQEELRQFVKTRQEQIERGEREPQYFDMNGDEI